MSRKTARREEAEDGLEDVVSGVGDIVGELVVPGIVCAVVVGVVVMVRAHPIISSIVAALFVVGTILVLSRHDARRGRPWRPRVYAVVAAILVAGVGILALVVMTIADACECP